MTGTLKNICISEAKGTVKHTVSDSILVENHGLKDDAHAGGWHRQVSLLDENDINSMQEKGLQLAPGVFGENLIIKDLNLSEFGIGTRLEIGDAELEITQIGKVCHTHCDIYFKTGDCIMPRAGLFARVLKGGDIKPGLKVEVISAVNRRIIQSAVLTVSDTCSSGKAIDTAGPAVSKMIETSIDARVGWHGIVADNLQEIKDILRDYSMRSFDLILTVGGTGCAERDVTPEATMEVIQKPVPGLTEAMRSSSMQITPHAMLQRGICGILRSTLIINLPGSKKAAEENLQVILPAIPHAISLLRGNTSHNAE